MTYEPALQTVLFDKTTNTRGFVVADRLVGGKAMGGTRISAGVSLAEVANLARRMSLKLALSEVPIGGAKGGIVFDPDVEHEQRAKHLASFGRLAGPLFRGGVYLGTDLGCTYDDRAYIYDCAKYSVEQQVPSLPCSWATLWKHCRDVTGYGVAHASAVAADALGLAPGRRRVAIQGFGEVGKAVARHGLDLGLDIVAVADKHGTVINDDGLPLRDLFEITDGLGTIDHNRLPDKVTLKTEPEAWLDVDADILVLAATGDAVTEVNVDRVRARIIAEGANGPTTTAAIERLTGKGCCVVPDIVANAGGAIGCGLALLGEIPSGSSPEQSAQWLFDQTARRVRANVDSIYKRSHAAGRTMHEVANALAEERAEVLLVP